MSHISVGPLSADQSALLLSLLNLSISGANQGIAKTSSTTFGNVTFGGSGGITSVSNADGTLTISPTTGAVIASINLAKANIWTGDITISKVLPKFTMTTADTYSTIINRTIGGLATRTNQTALIGTGYAINLDGSNYITTTTKAALDALTSFSVIGWVKLTTSSNALGFLWVKWNGADANAKFQLFRSGASYQTRMGGLASYSGSATIFDNTWRHVAMVYDGAAGTLKVYVNATLDLNQTPGTGVYTGTGNMHIGSRSGSFNSVGLFDQVWTYNRALSGAEITTIYNAGAGTGSPTTSGLVIGLDLDNNLTDNSGNGYSTAWNGSASYIAGKIITAGTAAEVTTNIWNSKDGTTINEYGITTFSDPNVTNIFDGLSYTFKVGGVSKGVLGSNGFWGFGNTTSPTAIVSVSGASASSAALALQVNSVNTITLTAGGQLDVQSGSFVLTNGASTVMSLAFSGKILFPFDFTVQAGNANTIIQSGVTLSAGATNRVALSVGGFSASQTADIFQANGITYALKTDANGRTGVAMGATTLTAYLHIAAGTATASTAPLKFTSGTLLTAAEVGAIEFLTDKFYGTITTGPARKEFTLNEGSLTATRVPFATTNGRLTDDAAMTFSGTRLTVTDLTLTNAPIISSLTAGRVVFAGASKELVDDADFTFATDTLTVTKIVGTTTIKVGTAAGYLSSDGSAGATGTFTTVDLKTVTVKDGIITSII